MTQTLYAHMNKIKIKKKKSVGPAKKGEDEGGERQEAGALARL
jgi:hypothetical protein